MRIILAAAASALLAACATNTEWTHSYKGEQAFYRDSARCESMARGGSGGTQAIEHDSAAVEGYNAAQAANAAGAQRRIFERCMMGRGWQAAGR